MSAKQNVCWKVIIIVIIIITTTSINSITTIIISMITITTIRKHAPTHSLPCLSKTHINYVWQTLYHRLHCSCSECCGQQTDNTNNRTTTEAPNQPHCFLFGCLRLRSGTVQNFDEFRRSCSHARMQVGLVG